MRNIDKQQEEEFQQSASSGRFSYARFLEPFFHSLCNSITIGACPIITFILSLFLTKNITLIIGASLPFGIQLLYIILYIIYNTRNVNKCSFWLSFAMCRHVASLVVLGVFTACICLAIGGLSASFVDAKISFKAPSEAFSTTTQAVSASGYVAFNKTLEAAEADVRMAVLDSVYYYAMAVKTSDDPEFVGGRYAAFVGMTSSEQINGTVISTLTKSLKASSYWKVVTSSPGYQAAVNAKGAAAVEFAVLEAYSPDTTGANWFIAFAVIAIIGFFASLVVTAISGAVALRRMKSLSYLESNFSNIAVEQ